jgi:RimJ/RimL family protein N-acetyltransferase
VKQGNNDMQQIETERLKLRVISEVDRVKFFELLSNFKLLAYISDTPSQEEIELQFMSRLQPWTIASQHWLTFSVFEKVSSNFIGINGFKHHEGGASVGFIFLPQYQGFGYATESLGAVCELAQQLGIKELSANITKGNVASEKVVKKCGFILANELLGTVNIGDKFHNDLEYKKLLNECA